MVSIVSFQFLRPRSSFVRDFGRRFFSSEKKPQIQVFRSATHDPLFNIATEDWIFNEGDLTKQTLYLWRNNPTVVIGRNQNPFKECHLAKMDEEGVTLARRYSGGGAVYQDLGNTNFTFLSPRDRYSKKNNTDIIISALARFGVYAEASGRNDILVDGHKVSGSAYKLSGDRAFHHGTLLINVDLDALTRYLNVNKEKLKSKGVASVRSRVVNLASVNPSITHDTLGDAIVQEFFRFYGEECPVKDLDFAELQKKDRLAKTYETLKDWKWRFGETPEFEHNLEHRFDWGIMDVFLNSKEGVITAVKIFSDTLYPGLVDLCRDCLQGARYDRVGVASALAEAKRRLLQTNEAEAASYIDEFSRWLCDQL
eukprot:TRINITY_DN3763_c0_g1_i5.p1 TRINITY_DN3763_c0_g1~~TRINITY_DN3763_c0_g1_i5.p1  ORF type:complete len:368 (-),score=31.46 TRINITY_DN3763_c0_g1_i5:1281-2384(-)